MSGKQREVGLLGCLVRDGPGLVTNSPGSVPGRRQGTIHSLPAGRIRAVTHTHFWKRRPGARDAAGLWDMQAAVTAAGDSGRLAEAGYRGLGCPCIEERA